MKKLLYTICLMLCVVACIAVCLTGCARIGTAGPYVTKIVFNDEGDLLVTKSTVVFIEAGPFSELRSEKPFTTVIKVPRK